MSVEIAEFVSELDDTKPPGSDLVAEGDDHLRLLKAVLQATFPNADKTFYFPQILSLSANYTFTIDDRNGLARVNATGGTVTITLPAKTLLEAGDRFYVLKTDDSANQVLVKANLGNINGQASIAISLPHTITEFVWSGTAWDTDQRAAMPWIAMREVTVAETLTHLDYGKLLLVGSGTTDFTVTLPTVTNRVGAIIGFKHAGTAGGVITIDAQGAQKIEGVNTYVLTAPNQIVWLGVFDGEWKIINSSYPSLTPDTENIWTSLQIFDNATLALYEQTLTFGATVAWDMSKGNHAKLNVTGNFTLAAPTNKTIPQTGFLRIIATAAAVPTWNAVYNWVTTAPTAYVDTDIKIYEYFVATSGIIYIWEVGTASGSGAGLSEIALGAIGQIGFFSRPGATKTFTAGTTYDGSELRYSSIGGGAGPSTGGATPTGTWMALGTNTDNAETRCSAFVRVS